MVYGPDGPPRTGWFGGAVLVVALAGAESRRPAHARRDRGGRGHPPRHHVGGVRPVRGGGGGGGLPGARAAAVRRAVGSTERANRGQVPADALGFRGAVPELHRARPTPDHSGLLISRASSPTTPRRKASTQITKITPCTMVTQAPSWAR